jgi:hypothetical protein
MVWPYPSKSRAVKILSRGVIVPDPRPPIIPMLLAELDRCLAQPGTPWRLYPQWQAQRQLLQRLRDVLSLWPTSGSQSLAPLQSDIQQLLAQRQTLQAEVADLTVQRSLLQSQMMMPLIDQVEQLELFQQRTNQVIRDVDGALQLTFRSFDQDMAAYQQGFAQRLGKLDDLSQQSETIVATLLQQLIQEVQQLRQLPPAVVARSPDALSIVAVNAPPAAAISRLPPPASGTTIGQLDELLGLLGLVDPPPMPPPAITDQGWPPLGWPTPIAEEFTRSDLRDQFELDEL